MATAKKARRKVRAKVKRFRRCGGKVRRHLKAKVLYVEVTCRYETKTEVDGDEIKMHKHVLMRDIMTSPVVFYDSDFKTQCKRFCKERNIDFLPSLSFDKQFHFINGEFQEKPLTSKQIITVEKHIFDGSLLDIFEQYSLIFVFDQEELVGVVHYCDYNRNPVFEYLYSLFLDFEKQLRNLSILKGLKNEDMSTFYQKHSTSEYYAQQLKKFSTEEMKQLEPFQTFTLKDLIGLLSSKDVIKINNNIIDLRNAIMHAKNVVKHHDYEQGALIYDFNSFKNFFTSVLSLQHEYRRVINRINFEKQQVSNSQ